MPATYRVPGVYYEPQPRAPEAVPVRTDVGGFVGFEPRVRDGSTPSALVGSPPVGHSFQVDVSGIQLFLGRVRARLPARSNVSLSQSASSIPVADGEVVLYALAAVLPPVGATLTLVVVAGAAAPYPRGIAPTDDAIVAAIASGRPWARVADVAVRRVADEVHVTVLPALKATRCDDWDDYLLAFGAPVDDGTLLAPAVRAYFANGGRRCWVSTVRRPSFFDARELENARLDMVGAAGASEADATGLARLLLVPEVTFADVPDLYARRVDTSTTTVKLAPPDTEACFRPCGTFAPPIVATAVRRAPAWAPIYLPYPVASNDVLATQRALVELAVPEAWRMLVLLSVPLAYDPATGAYVPPTALDADAWRAQLDGAIKLGALADARSAACAALYWPWLLQQPRVGADVATMPPSPFAAGVIARRDLARGPQISPANESLNQVVATAAPVDDDANALLYSPLPDAHGDDVLAVNVFRPFAGLGVQLWGARTMSTDTWLRYLAVRRTLTAIELRMRAALEMLVFEPNTPSLWMHITHIALSVLLPIFESGALRGSRPEEAFYVRCDGSINGGGTIEAGQLLVEVGVAIAAPAEFIVFRVGRREGVVEVLE